MSVYMKLLALEVRRFRYMLVLLMLYTLVVEWLSVWQEIKSFSDRFGRQRAMPGSFDDSGNLISGSKQATLPFADVLGNAQQGFALAIIVPLAVLLAYVLFIWYRDWVGKHPFVYRQLMLPGGRTPLYFAKLTALLLFIFTMLGWQLLLLPLLQLEYEWLAPAWMQESSLFTDAIVSNRVIYLLLPISFTAFLYQYAVGIWLVLLLFVAILLERSYRIRGIVYAVLYIAVNVALLGVFAYSLERYLYFSEMRAVLMTIYGLEVAAAIWLSMRLINRKVSV